MEYLGFAFAMCCGYAALLLLIYGLCLVSNRLTHYALDAYGGWHTFLRYREWYLKEYTEDKK